MLKLVLVLCVALFVSSRVLLKTNYLGALNGDLLFAKRSANDFVANPAPEQYFTQKVDHYDPLNTDTWQQRYFVNETLRKNANSPVFFMLGGEGPMSAAVVGGRFIMNTYAAAIPEGALIVAVEHRFYGKSNPKPNLSTQSLRFLTTEQALADFAAVRQHIVQQYKVSPDAKFIAFGGSYSGNLAAWIRIKYPHLFAGAIASSAPVLASVDFPEYMDVVAASIGADCNARLRAATDSLDTLLNSADGTRQAASMFSACSSMQSDIDKTVFVSALADPVCGVVQYNNDNNNYQSFNITRMCSMLTASNNPLADYVAFIKEYNKESSTQCTQSTYSSYLSQLQDERTFDQGNDNSAGRSWTWQYCTEYGYWQYARGSNQPFSTRLTREFFAKQCADVFNVPGLYPNTEYVNTEYGAKNPQGSNIYFTNGNIDPWHFLGMTSTIKQGEPAYFMKGTAHCADLYPPRSSDVSDLKNARVEQLYSISEWISGK